MCLFSLLLSCALSTLTADTTRFAPGCTASLCGAIGADDYSDVYSKPWCRRESFVLGLWSWPTWTMSCIFHNVPRVTRWQLLGRETMQGTLSLNKLQWSKLFVSNKLILGMLCMLCVGTKSVYWDKCTISCRVFDNMPWFMENSHWKFLAPCRVSYNTPAFYITVSW